MKAPQFLNRLPLVRCGVRHALFREEQLHYLKQKFCFSGPNLEGWLEWSWVALPRSLQVLWGWRRVQLWHWFRRVHQSSLCLLPGHGKGHLCEPSLRGRDILNGRTDMKGASRKDERSEYADCLDVGTPSCTEVPQRYGPYCESSPTECTRYMKLEEHRMSSK